jgi:osmotically-inducible protein OsmY
MKTKTSLPGIAAGLALALLAACANTTAPDPNSAYVDDATLRNNVQSSLIHQEGLPASDITVETYDGQVRLSGFLASQEQINQAVAAARSITGVKVVNNELRLK